MSTKTKSELQVVTAAKNLCSYVLIATNKSPKCFRFTLVSRLQNLTLNIIENIYRANEIFVQSKNLQNMQKRLEFQHSALTDVKILAYISLLAREQGCILPKQYEQICKLASDCQYLLYFFLFIFEFSIKPSANVIISPKPETAKYVTSSPVFVDSSASAFSSSVNLS